MAKQKGLIKLEGTMGDITFYKSKGGMKAKEKSAISAARIKKDPKFIRTRENGSEFGHSAKAGKLLRKAIQPLLMHVKDQFVVSRVTKLMTEIKNLDGTSARGLRNVAQGIQHPDGLPKFKGFNFNEDAPLESVLGPQVNVDSATGGIDLGDFRPDLHVVSPLGATHVQLRSAWLKLDFATGDYKLAESSAVNLLINSAITPVNLVPTAPASGSGVNFYLLLVEFFQEVNGVQYQLNNGEFNSLAISAVAA